MRTLKIVGRCWTSRSRGDMYYSAKAYIDGKLVTTIPCTHGEDYIRHTTGYIGVMGLLKGLKKHPHGGFEAIWKYCKRERIELACSTTDVKRKRDL